MGENAVQRYNNFTTCANFSARKFYFFDKKSY